METEKVLQQQEQQENIGEGEKVKELKEALADYVISRMPKDMADSLYEGKAVGELVAQWENSKLKKENEDLRLKLEKLEEKPLKLTGQGGTAEKDPFALGFLQAMSNY